MAIKGTMIKIPHTPYTTEGIPAKISITGCIILTNLGLAYCVKYRAENMQIGPAIIIARIVIKTELRIKGRNPKLPLLGSQAEEKKIFTIGRDPSSKDDLRAILINMTTGVNITSASVTTIIIVL